MTFAEAADVLEALPLERLKADICTVTAHRNAFFILDDYDDGDPTLN